MDHKIIEPETALNLHNEKQQRKFGASLAKACQNTRSVIYLQGDLGAGKTTAARGFLNELGYAGSVKSPTYTLIETYEFHDKTVLHIDLYRLAHPKEVHALGLRDYCSADQQVIYLIEWPEKAAGELLSPDIACYIAPCRTGRQCRLTASTLQGKKILSRMNINFT